MFAIRSTFFIATLVALLFALCSPVSAVPQFGRVHMHVLPGEIPVTTIEGSSTVVINQGEMSVALSATTSPSAGAAITTAAPDAAALSSKSSNGGIAPLYISPLTLGFFSATTALFVFAI
ncbi:hypothetical protein FIBSPDRAFT_965342 [Athelia psychrophila]|uniref:Uncharacterized protein n=1 Tax=Athelia psychrophila TaxID=1759441 RepID=A0A165WNH3_9AGAM|nr:hypothetical protein FIBSPDRAFT_965342 [Fibularhizoctonia sp. CBS 109695]